MAETSKAKIYSLKFNNENVMTLADIMIGKTGGLSSCEALSKCVPIIALEYAPMPEYSNLLYLEDKKVAIKLKKLSEIYNTIKTLDIPSMQKNCKSIQKNQASDLIYNHVVETVKKTAK